jgi:uncharacterized protein
VRQRQQRFAGQWTERQGSAAFPVEGQRIYEFAQMPERKVIGGRLRKASANDRDLVVAWMRGFYADVGQEVRDHEPVVERRLAAGQFWLWEDGEPVSMAANSEPVEGVLRVQAVYTPPDRRNRGYAGACVGDLSLHMRDEGYGCILYADLAIRPPTRCTAGSATTPSPKPCGTDSSEIPTRVGWGDEDRGDAHLPASRTRSLAR